MSRILLKFISLETLITFLVEALASTVKNPKSDVARILRRRVEILHSTTGEFLERVPKV